MAVSTALATHFRRHGWRVAKVNPLSPGQTLGVAPALPMPHVQPSEVGAAQRLVAWYCGAIGWDVFDTGDSAVDKWFVAAIEDDDGVGCQAPPDVHRLAALGLLAAVSASDAQLATAYPSHPRFSVRGVDTVVPLLMLAMHEASAGGTRGIVLSTSHRGRLALLAHVVGVPLPRLLANVFHQHGGVTYDDLCAPAQGRRTFNHGGSVDVTMPGIPAHLEATTPAALGSARAQQLALGADVMACVTHGDAAFWSQGQVVEALQLACVKGFECGGALHVVLNNQIGFTTQLRQQLAASSPSAYGATDVARAVRAPVIHVNANHVDAVLRVAKVAVQFRRAFNRDIVIDLVGFRRFGHNELDEPRFTNDDMYGTIDHLPRVVDTYADQLRGEGVPGVDAALGGCPPGDPLGVTATSPSATFGAGAVADGTAPAATPALSMEVYHKVADALDPGALPKGTQLHPRLRRVLAVRHRTLVDGRGIDMATGEALAYGSLLAEGFAVRLSGEDVERGTFSQRHAVVAGCTPLDALNPGGFEVVNSPLSEYGVLAYEYGRAVGAPVGAPTVTVWEAQFGDFASGGQVVIDTLITQAAAKWGTSVPLVLQLPHGLDGMGPEHSSARLGRWLEMHAPVAPSGSNFTAVVPTNAASLCHAIRQHAHSRPRRPLVLFTPKRLLRAPHATSDRDAFVSGRGFAPIDVCHGGAGLPSARRLVLACGCFGADVGAAAAQGGHDTTAVVLLQQLAPFPGEALQAVLQHAPPGVELVWAQEEPFNFGAARYVMHAAASVTGGRPLHYVGRPTHALPGGGDPAAHRAEQARLVATALGV